MARQLSFCVLVLFSFQIASAPIQAAPKVSAGDVLVDSWEETQGALQRSLSTLLTLFWYAMGAMVFLAIVGSLFDNGPEVDKVESEKPGSERPGYLPPERPVTISPGFCAESHHETIPSAAPSSLCTRSHGRRVGRFQVGSGTGE